MICPYCSEEHPLTMTHCPLTGGQLREPTVPEADRAPPIGFFALLIEAASLYIHNLGAFLVTGFVVFVPSLIATALTWNTVPEPLFGHPRPWSYLGLLTVPGILVLQFFGNAALVPLVGDRALGGSMGPGRAWLAVGVRGLPALGTGLLYTLICMAGTLCCIIPGIVATLGFALCTPVVMLEGQSGLDALKRSWSLMSGQRWRIFGLWFMAIAFCFVLIFPVWLYTFTNTNPMFSNRSYDPGMVPMQIGGAARIALSLWQLFVSAALYPLTAIGTTLVYIHARRENEGIPVEELQRQMQRAASP